MSDTKSTALVAGGNARGIIPQSFEDAYRLARVFAATKMVPKDFQDKPEDCCVAILQGLELGLSPMAALQSIAVINGRPCLWGDGMIAVVRASGLLEWIKETDDGSTATCTVKRKGEPEPVTRTFSQEDAKRAGLAGKSGPWTQYPQRMRPARARSWALRDVFADVLKGIQSAEEQNDVHEMKDVTPVAARPLAIMDELPDIPDGTESAATEKPQTDAEFLAGFRHHISVHKDDHDAIAGIRDAHAEEIAERGLEQQCEDIIADVTGDATDEASLPSDDMPDIPWETAETASETPATLGDEAATAAVKGIEMRLAKLHNATVIKECWRNFGSVFDQLGPDAQALATKARDAALARVKKSLQAAE